jgi:hypothetical protein
MFATASKLQKRVEREESRPHWQQQQRQKPTHEQDFEENSHENEENECSYHSTQKKQKLDQQNTFFDQKQKEYEKETSSSSSFGLSLRESLMKNRYNSRLLQEEGEERAQELENSTRKRSTTASHSVNKQITDEGIAFDLSTKRKMTVRKWKAAVLVDVREYYDDNGMSKPGKKGN